MKCIGIGKFIKDPKIKDIITGDKKVKICQFALLCEEKRNDSAVIDEDVFLFTVWDSAAEYIVKNARKDSIIYYEAVPKKYIYFEDNEDKPRISVTFRINNFRILY